MKRRFRAILTYFDRLAVEFAEILKGPKEPIQLSTSFDIF